MGIDSFSARSTLRVGDRSFTIHRLDALGALGTQVGVDRLPMSLKILLENLLRHEDGVHVRAVDVETLAGWSPHAGATREIAFSPERVLMQDFTGVPAIADLTALRDAVEALGGRPAAVNPLVPVELVIDHSVIVERAGTPDAFAWNAELEMWRNRERYQLLRWAQHAFDNVKVVPPDTGICHQVNLEHLARVVMERDGEAFCDTLVGTDSHTTMVNGVGVLGWGVGGIEAEAAMLGRPVSMLVPPVVGVHLSGELPPGTTATDLVLTVCRMLREHGVVGKFVEFMGDALQSLSVETRATIANMAPEYGATCGYMPIDAATLDYLRLTGRTPERVALVEAYAKEQGIFRVDGALEPIVSERLTLDLTTVEPCVAGPSRPQDRVRLAEVPGSVAGAITHRDDPVTGAPATPPLQRAATAATREGPGGARPLRDGDVVIAAITSCTNTSNPEVMVAAGLLAAKAVERGLVPHPWVKASLAPGSRVVMDYLERAGLTGPLAALGFALVGYGCTTCIGNSGPLNEGVSEEVGTGRLSVSAVLSGNRNFEGRVHPDVRLNYLASPPLVVAYALAGTMDIDLTREPIGTGSDGKPAHLADLWPSMSEVRATIAAALGPDEFRTRYAEVYEGDEVWRTMEIPQGERFDWDPLSTYVRRPPFVEDLRPEPDAPEDIVRARVLALLGDSVTTDHISPAGSIVPSSPAGAYLLEHGVEREEFNSYGARRGNHEVMMRGTFGNVRLRNLLAPGTEGGWTRHLPSGEVCTIFDAAERYRSEGVPLVVVAGRLYGSGSSRDWAAKGPWMLGVRAVIAESFERIHRSNLVGMGILPLELFEPDTVAGFGFTGEEEISIRGLAGIGAGDVPKDITIEANGREVRVRVRIDTPAEAEYFRHGGILPYMARRLAKA